MRQARRLWVDPRVRPEDDGGEVAGDFNGQLDALDHPSIPIERFSDLSPRFTATDSDIAQLTVGHIRECTAGLALDVPGAAGEPSIVESGAYRAAS